MPAQSAASVAWSVKTGWGGVTSVYASQGLSMIPCAKVNYPSQAAAKFAAARIAGYLRKRGATRVPRGVHPCAECHGWHITSHRTNARLRLPVV